MSIVLLGLLEVNVESKSRSMTSVSAIVLCKMVTLLFALGIGLELLLTWWTFLWQWRQSFLVIVVLIIGFSAGAVIASSTLISGTALLVISAFRIINLLRIARFNGPETHIRNKARRTSAFFALFQLALIGITATSIHVEIDSLFLVLAVLQLVAAFFVLNIATRNLYKTKHHKTKHFYSDSELPTVTVAIPARNETDDLSSCLHSVLANKYPKLEVLVLDDCSQDRTGEVIKGFAQEGVRFLKGAPPKDRWLAKNQAYDKLADQATGELILFCGVDVRLGPEAIRSLVTTLLNKKRSMISVMPLRIGGGVKTALIQPMRYWWELALPRRFFNRPAVLSTCWLIKRKVLKKLGGFDAVTHTVVPEGYFARELVQNDQYAFIRADEQLDVRTVKSVAAQKLTAVRTWYPQLRKRPENVLIITVLEIALLLGPFLIAGISWWVGYKASFAIATLASLLLICTHYLILSASNPANSMIALINFPFVVLTELVMISTSMYKYEFSTVEWKGRNICLPVMQVTRKLPGS